MKKHLKKILKASLPPLIFKLYNYVYYKFPINNFKIYWNKNSYKFNDLDNSDIFNITNQFVKSKSYKMVSNYWNYLNIKNYNSILKKGIKNYSTTITTNYFTFLSYDDALIKKTLDNIRNVKVNLNFNFFKIHDNFTYQESLNYNIILLILYENLRKIETFNLLKKLNDRAYLGYNDPFLLIDNIKVTHDKLNSLIDYNIIKNLPSFNNKKDKKILEIGAGSARTSEAILTFNDNINYVICDIPFAIIIAYKRLKKAFPDKKISILFDEVDSEYLKNKILENDISFIFPHQLSLIKNNFFDFALAIDCLHEMDKKTVSQYLKSISSNSSYLYFSVWKNTFVPFSFNKYNFDKNDYKIPKNWELIFKKNAVFPSNYWNICYKTNIK